MSPNPVKIAAKMIAEFEALTDIPAPYPADLAKAIREGRDAAERALGPGGADLKFWRERGVPSYYYGPTNHGMGTVDEYVEVEELIHVAKVHLLSAYEYLKK